MVSDNEKVGNRAWLWGLTTLCLTMGIYEMVEESSATLTLQIGRQFYITLKKELDPFLVDEKPEDVLQKVGNFFIDHYGIASGVTVERIENTVKMTFKDAIGTAEYAILRDRGVKNAFSHPFLCVGLAMLEKKGLRSRTRVELDTTQNITIINYDLV